MTGMEHAIEQAAKDARTALLDKWGTAPSGRRTMSPHRAGCIVRLVIDTLSEAGLLTPAPLREAITIPRPHVAHGPKHLTAEQADADYLREAAQTLDEFYKPFGSNVRATVVKLLNDAADAVDRTEGDGRADCPCAYCHSRPYSVMHVCPDCGSKRCARAAHHVNPCEAGR